MGNATAVKVGCRWVRMAVSSSCVIAVPLCYLQARQYRLLTMPRACPLASQVVQTPGPASSVYRLTTHSSYRSIHDTLYRSNRIASIDRYRVALDYPLTSLSTIPVSSKFPNRERPIPRNCQKGGCLRWELATLYCLLLSTQLHLNMPMGRRSPGGN